MFRSNAANIKPVSYTRNPIYVFYALFAVVIYVTSWLLVDRANVGFFEETVFTLVYALPGFLLALFVISLVVGVIGTILWFVSFSIFQRRIDTITRTFMVLLIAAILSVWLSNVISRDSPPDLLPDVVPRLGLTGFGFPSPLMSVITVGGLTLALYVPSRYRRWILRSMGLMGLTLIFLAMSMPLDVVAGYAVGLFSYSICSLIFGSIYKPIDVDNLVAKLQLGGLKNVKLKPASVDARGSVPFFGTQANQPIFVKVFNQDNNAADWLFKLTRRVRYRRLEDEVPSLTPKRAIEHEAYITMLAKYSAQARVPAVIGIYNVGHNAYALVSERVESDGLNYIDDSKVTDSLLKKTWAEINKLHETGIIHKDLRTANVIIEKSTGLPWIIDFGFSESAVNQHSFYKDAVEFIASSAVKVGARRAVKAAFASIGHKATVNALPYMKFSALSRDTSTRLKLVSGLLNEIRSEIQRQSEVVTVKKQKVTAKQII